MIEPMTIRRAFGAIVASMGVGAGLGTCLGWATALFSPGYYSALFRRRSDEAAIDAVQVGVGLGLTQGALIGAFLGVVVVALLTWQYVRTSDRPRRLP